MALDLVQDRAREVENHTPPPGILLSPQGYSPRPEVPGGEVLGQYMTAYMSYYP